MGYTHDPASQVTNILHQLTATSTQINKADYVYNPVGNRTSLTDRRGNQAFGYDQLDRLTSASHPLLLDPQAFAYDAVGNRTTNGSVVNTANQLTADANFAYQYDDNGNLTRKTLLATGNYSQYTYDAENRLTQVQEFAAGNPTAITTSNYRYDGLGRRIEKVANGQTKRYIYDGEDILLEYDGSNVLQARYTHGPGIDEPIAVTKGASTFFYHQDGLGTVTDLTDSVGATAKSYSYDAYGNILDSPGTVEQSYTYTGREFDSETGLYYYRARYYDAATGRFLQKDMVGIKRGSNLYSYLRDNPSNGTDSTGLDASLRPYDVGRASKSFVPRSDKRPLGTILCNDGNPEVWIQDYYNDLQSQECGLSECLFKHEGVHLADALSRQPLVCSGTKKSKKRRSSSAQELGPQILFGDRLASESEIRAYLTEENCLKEALNKTRGDCPCGSLLNDRLNDVKLFLYPE